MLRVVTALLIALVLPAGAATTLIGWEEAAQHVGEEVIVRGRVLGVHCAPSSCLLAFDPSFNRFTVLIPAEHFDAFPPDRLEDTFSGKKVQVHGTIRMKERKPEIVVDDPADLKVTMSERMREEREADQERAQVHLEMLDRLGEVLERLENLTERMAQVQDRMDVLLGQLEQRTAMIGAQQQALMAQAGQPDTPTAPENWGLPQPRPVYEALRTIKRGMTSDQVQRLVGTPDRVEYGSGGAAVWYYGFGRSISFDGRGRAQALTGFPQP